MIQWDARATRAGQNDPEKCITYNCSEFKGFTFENKRFYEITYVNGEILIVKCTRRRKTLYSGPIKTPFSYAIPPYGQYNTKELKYYHPVTSIKLLEN